MVGIILAGGMLPIGARAGTTFTWDPAGASPSLNAPAFTADAIQGGHYLYSAGPKVIPSAIIYTSSFIEPITGFTLGGTPVSTPGLNGTPGAAGSYGLYVRMDLQTLAVSPTDTEFLGGTVKLMADPGNNNGAVSSTATGGLTFANTSSTGTQDDITLATGSLVSAGLSYNPTPSIARIGDFVETLQPVAGEDGFFVSPNSGDILIEEILTTPVAAVLAGEAGVAPDPNDPSLQISFIDGGLATAAIDLQVPEPPSLVLLGSRLIGLAALRSRRRLR
jgi:hypothetical protein